MIDLPPEPGSVGLLRSRLAALEDWGVVERIGAAVVSGTCCLRSFTATSGAGATPGERV